MLSAASISSLEILQSLRSLRMTKMIVHSFQTRFQVLFGNDIGCQAKYVIYMVTYPVGLINRKSVTYVSERLAVFLPGPKSQRD
jgi:hypothetical protein